MALNFKYFWDNRGTENSPFQTNSGAGPTWINNNDTMRFDMVSGEYVQIKMKRNWEAIFHINVDYGFNLNPNGFLYGAYNISNAVGEPLPSRFIVLNNSSFRQGGNIQIKLQSQDEMRMQIKDGLTNTAFSIIDGTDGKQYEFRNASVTDSNYGWLPSDIMRGWGGADEIKLTLKSVANEWSQSFGERYGSWYPLLEWKRPSTAQPPVYVQPVGYSVVTGAKAGSTNRLEVVESLVVTWGGEEYNAQIALPPWHDINRPYPGELIYDNAGREIGRLSSKTATEFIFDSNILIDVGTNENLGIGQEVILTVWARDQTSLSWTEGDSSWTETVEREIVGGGDGNYPALFEYASADVTTRTATITLISSMNADNMLTGFAGDYYWTPSNMHVGGYSWFQPQESFVVGDPNYLAYRDTAIVIGNKIVAASKVLFQSNFIADVDLLPEDPFVIEEGEDPREEGFDESNLEGGTVEDPIVVTETDPRPEWKEINPDLPKTLDQIYMLHAGNPNGVDPTRTSPFDIFFLRGQANNAYRFLDPNTLEITNKDYTGWQFWSSDDVEGTGAVRMIPRKGYTVSMQLYSETMGMMDFTLNGEFDDSLEIDVDRNEDGIAHFKIIAGNRNILEYDENLDEDVELRLLNYSTPEGLVCPEGFVLSEDGTQCIPFEDAPIYTIIPEFNWGDLILVTMLTIGALFATAWILKKGGVSDS